MASGQNLPCSLGPLELSGFEVPTAFRRQGRQQAAVHRLIGGGRVIQLLGPDPERRILQGSFSGSRAVERAQLLEVLRDLGEPLILTVGAWTEIVLIVSASIAYRARGALIDFTVEAEPVFVPTLAIAESVAAVAGGIVSALTTSLGLFGGVGTGLAFAGVSAGAAAIATVLSGDFSSDAGRAAGATGLAAAASGVGVAIASAGSALTALSAGGSDLVPNAGSLTAATSLAGGLASSVQGSGYLNQASGGLSSLGGLAGGFARS